MKPWVILKGESVRCAAVRLGIYPVLPFLSVPRGRSCNPDDVPCLARSLWHDPMDVVAVTGQIPSFQKRLHSRTGMTVTQLPSCLHPRQLLPEQLRLYSW